MKKITTRNRVSSIQLLHKLLAIMFAYHYLSFAETKVFASGSLYLNGTTNSFMQFAEKLAINEFSFTLEFWCKPDSLGDIISETSGDSSGDSIHPNKFILDLDSLTTGFGSECGYTTSYFPTTIAIGHWQHVALVGYDPILNNPTVLFLSQWHFSFI